MVTDRNGLGYLGYFIDLLRPQSCLPDHGDLFVLELSPVKHRVLNVEDKNPVEIGLKTIVAPSKVTTAS